MAHLRGQEQNPYSEWEVRSMARKAIDSKVIDDVIDKAADAELSLNSIDLRVFQGDDEVKTAIQIARNAVAYARTLTVIKYKYKSKR